MSSERHLPKYKCHKEVYALKIARIDMPPRDDRHDSDGAAFLIPEDSRYGAIRVSHEYQRKHNPKEGGYYVRYGDGYESFSPAAPFESGYTLAD